MTAADTTEPGTTALGLPSPDPFPGYLPVRSTALPDDLLGVFRPGDELLRWHLDFHYPLGIVPLGHEILAMVYRGSQEAADALPVPTGRGLVGRLVGPHVYTAGRGVADQTSVAQRAAASAADIATYPDRFAAEWAAEAAGLAAAHARLDARIADARDLRALGPVFAQAGELCARSWRTHFDVMYRLLAVMASFRTVCTALGLADDDVSSLLGSGDTSVQRTDRWLWELGRAAVTAGLRPAFAAQTGPALLATLEGTAPGRAWLVSFRELVDTVGTRGDAVADVAGPSWVEAPERPLGLVRLLLEGGADPTAVAEDQQRLREERCELLRARLAPRQRATFDRSYAWACRANFAWWNEEHNTHIDLRAHLPIRSIGRAVATAAGGHPDDGLMLYAGEVRDLTAGDVTWPELAGLVVARRRYIASWRPRRLALPRAVGPVPDHPDPLMTEIIGTDQPAARSFPALLRGLPVSPGRARGRVRLVGDVSQLDRVEPGDVLVCEATSPSWTPVFPSLAACLCDSGGALTHAAIICREYGLPCVCALGVAMQTLHDGDVVEVDGGTGTVTVLRRA